MTTAIRSEHSYIGTDGAQWKTRWADTRPEARDIEAAYRRDGADTIVVLPDRILGAWKITAQFKTATAARGADRTYSVSIRSGGRRWVVLTTPDRDVADAYGSGYEAEWAPAVDEVTRGQQGRWGTPEQHLGFAIEAICAHEAPPDMSRQVVR